MVCISVLMALRSHLLAAANFGRYEGVHEVEYAKPLVDSIPESSLTILDRGYLNASFLLRIERGADRHWLTRAKKNTKFKVIKRLARGRRVGRDDGFSTGSPKRSVTASYLGSSSHPL